MKSFIKFASATLLGSVLTVGFIFSSAHAFSLWNIVTTGDWETIIPLKQKIDVKGEDLRIYTWPAPLNSSYACSAVFSNAGTSTVCFPVDPNHELVNVED